MENVPKNIWLELFSNDDFLFGMRGVVMEKQRQRIVEVFQGPLVKQEELASRGAIAQNADTEIADDMANAITRQEIRLEPVSENIVTLGNSYGITVDVIKAICNRDAWSRAWSRGDWSQGKSPERLRDLASNMVSVLAECNLEESAGRIPEFLEQWARIEAARPREQRQIAMPIQKQVYQMKQPDASAEVTRILTFLRLAEMAHYINTIHQHERGTIYDQYVRAGCDSGAEYYAAKARPDTFRKMIDFWRHRKDVGQKILRLTERFGIGFLLTLPKSFNLYTNFRRFNKVELELLAHGLRSAPWSDQFAQQCREGTRLLESLDEQGSNALNLQAQITNDIHEGDDLFEDSLEFQPMHFSHVEV
ncbi:MAG: hypothetical protein Q9218_001092 [Villophora microphyllina]